MKIAVILENAPDVELERVEFEASDNDASGRIGTIIEEWVLSVGDTIRIVELQP